MTVTLSSSANIGFETVRVTLGHGVSRCPHCGHPMAKGDKLDQLFVGKSRRIFEMVRKAGAAGIGTEAIHERLYGQDSRQPPDIKVIAVFISQRINKKLKPFGLKIRSRPGIGGEPYRLLPIEEGK